jgi:hypothetical protein
MFNITLKRIPNSQEWLDLHAEIARQLGVRHALTERVVRYGGKPRWEYFADGFSLVHVQPQPYLTEIEASTFGSRKEGRVLIKLNKIDNSVSILVEHENALRSALAGYSLKKYFRELGQ